MKILFITFIFLISIISLLLIIRMIAKTFIKLNYSKDKEIFLEKEVVLGGIKQTILLEGKNKNLPIMIMFHGGPWGPIVYGESYRGFYPKLSNNCILVWWDQYGCGKNYVKDISQNITVYTFADMAVDLVLEIEKLFPKNKIYLNGSSFGSYLSTYAASKLENKISGIINWGPIVNMKSSTNNFFMACKDKLTDKEKRKLESYKNADYITYEIELENLAEKYTNCAHYKGKDGKDSLTLKWLLRLFISPDYSLKDTLGVIKAFKTVGKTYLKMWNSLGEINIINLIEKLKIPILFLQGEEELFILSQNLEKIAKKHGNITYCKLPHSGHIPTYEAWSKMVDKMINFVHSSY
ncbi:alpha/beta fold hydrolase [Clostridium sp. BJN0001]|uniref:alpha/beta fold hydrolase n=1 Tax=Clostridium sp. BJN0001 TaxID=2930219 RepID=UPI001FD5DDA8|nr:alpha/beta fold hydrolase [Clostridium sp. BJN0001]